MLGNHWQVGVMFMFEGLVFLGIAGYFWRRGYVVGGYGQHYTRRAHPLTFWWDEVALLIMAGMTVGLGVFLLLVHTRY